jgi:cytochrome c biogenesis protein CcmG, thiol:disulfide interchange protein DsbE
MLTTTHKALVLVFSVLVFVGLAVAVEGRGSEEVRQVMIEDIAALGAETADRPAPDWTLPTDGGGQLSLSDLRGKVVFLNFWATFCVPCREEMPSMERLARKYKDRDLVMVAISQDEDLPPMRRFLGQVMPDGALTMLIPLDKDGAVKQAYGTQLLPETYIIDREGKIVARFVNKYDWERDEVDRFIDRLLEQ